MTLRLLDLNCQHGYQPGFASFFRKVLAERTYDALLLQEADESVSALIQDVGGYSVIDFAEGKSWPKLLIRDDHAVIDSSTLPFENDERIAYGLVCARIRVGDEDIVLAATHLVAGFSTDKRLRQVHQIREHLNEHYPDTALILAGDFNTGFPGEYTRARAALAPLSNVSERLGATIDSGYSENSRFIASKIALFLANTSIRFRLKLDHVYASTSLGPRVSCEKLVSRISDHSAFKIIVASQL